MTDPDDAQAELMRRFEAVIAGLDRTQLHDIGRSLLDAPLRGPRPELRRPPLAEPVTLRIRVDLDGAEPPIWRRLDIRGDLTLDVVHLVLQAAFDWTDSHLHRFSLGGHPFHPTAQLFLCPFDVAEDDDDGLPASQVRLDETVQTPGDRLHYAYDYGDSWELTLRVEKVLPPRDAPVSAVGGARAAPPEDSGGGTDLAALSLVVPDPAAFDLTAVDARLQSVAVLAGVDPRAAELCAQLAHLPIGRSLARALARPVSTPSDAEIIDGTRAFAWFLARAADGGLPLTSAGYLRPDDVLGAAAVVPAAAGWIGARNREIQTVPVLVFRECLRRLGLLRKYKGTLRLTRKGTAAHAGPGHLWSTLAAGLVPSEAGFDRDATLLLLARAADPGPQPVSLTDVAVGLAAVGYGHRDGSPVDRGDLVQLEALTVLDNIAAPTRLAATLARSALQR